MTFWGQRICILAQQILGPGDIAKGSPWPWNTTCPILAAPGYRPPGVSAGSRNLFIVQRNTTDNRVPLWCGREEKNNLLRAKLGKPGVESYAQSSATFLDHSLTDVCIGLSESTSVVRQTWVWIPTLPLTGCWWVSFSICELSLLLHERNENTYIIEVVKRSEIMYIKHLFSNLWQIWWWHWPAWIISAVCWFPLCKRDMEGRGDKLPLRLAPFQKQINWQQRKLPSQSRALMWWVLRALTSQGAHNW